MLQTVTSPIRTLSYVTYNDDLDSTIYRVSATIERVGDYTSEADRGNLSTLRNIEQFVRLVSKETYWKSFLHMPDEKKVDLFVICEGSESLNLCMTLNALKPESKPQHFSAYKSSTFTDFKNLLVSVFTESFSDLGSDHFQSRLHQYFVVHGLDPASKHSVETGYVPRGRYDSLMTHSALVLKDIYGEQKVIDLLDRVIEETPLRPKGDDGSRYPEVDPLTISALDFTLLIQSDIDYSEIPLSWAVKLLPDPLPDGLECFLSN